MKKLFQPKLFRCLKDYNRHDSNTELIALGIGNIASGIFGGIPATGAIARTAANVKNGGRTPISGMVHAVVLLLCLLVLMPAAKLIPCPLSPRYSLWSRTI